MLVSNLETTAQADLELTREDVDRFERDGFLISRNLAPARLCERMRQVAVDQLEKQSGTLEYEADLQYPGAPESLDAPGGETIRRLKQAHARHISFTEWVCYLPLVRRLEQLLGPRIAMPLAHHNCIMTKQPAFSSDTDWHQDVRYWHFQRHDLVNAWLALGDENRRNGALRLIPGSHRLHFEPRQFDERLFFRHDTAPNQALIQRHVTMTLRPGDVVFFHARCLHSASRNHTDHTKYSVVFSFRPADNAPMPGTRSASAAELRIP